MRFHDYMAAKRPQYAGDRVPILVRLPVAEKELLDKRRGASGLTNSEYVAKLIRRDTVDAAGVPTWLSEDDAQPVQERLIA